MPKRVVISQLGSHDVLKYQEYNLPKELKPNDVRIQQTSIGLNYIDTYHRSGVYPLPSDLPICLGLEAAGKVIELGKNITNLKIGDRVGYATIPLGAYCEIRDFPEDKLIKIPDYITNDEAASILLQGMTVEYLFERLYKIKKDEFILFHAAAGGVGLIASQWSKIIGCKMIGTVSSKEKANLALKNGCSHVINYKEENVVEKVMDITKNQGVPIVYDGVGEDTFKISLNCLQTRGLMVSFGQSSGMVKNVSLHSAFNPKSLFFTRPTLMHYTRNREELNISSTSLFNKMKTKQLRTNIYKIFDLKDASEAHRVLEARETKGSVILKP
tara:strand:- start:19936 stop:20919 length:984 start_codon:yes stop_codon:yes gene_type:complete